MELLYKDEFVKGDPPWANPSLYRRKCVIVCVQMDAEDKIYSKYNVFNARINSLEIRNTWLSLFMKNHGLVPLTGFYEWLSGADGKPRLINFFPEGREVMWAPCLWDEWISKDGSIQFN